MLLKNNKLKSKLKIENPHHLNTKNYRRDGSIVEINYIGNESRINASDKRAYEVYRFNAHKTTSARDVIFEIHNTIHNNKVQVNMWKDGGFTAGSMNLDVIKNRDELINRMIEWLN